MNAIIENPGVTLVPEDERMDFLPDLFGLRMMDVENAVYAFMDQLCAQYSGGMWDFIKIDSGGGYLRPQRPDGEEMHLKWALNYSDETVSPDAAGIVATLFALSHVSFKCSEREQWNAAERLSKVHRQITEYAWTHPEASKISALTD